MRWDKVNCDSYYMAREQEFLAKRYEKYGDLRKALQCWQIYTDIKERKGSYVLAIFGHHQIGRLFRIQGNQDGSDTAHDKIKALSKRCNGHYELLSFYNKALELELKGTLHEALEHYEKIGEFFFNNDNYFLAADAFEHAAELRYVLCRSLDDYFLPLKAWKANSEYWKDLGEIDDSKWSNEREKYFKDLYRQ